MASTTTPADDARIALRREEALRLRLTGLRLRDIGRALGVSHETVRKDIQEELDASAERADGMADRVRALELERLDEARSRVFAILKTAEDPELLLKAADRVVRLSEQTAKLSGAYAPERLDATVTEGPTPEAASRLVREVFAVKETHGDGDARADSGDAAPAGAESSGPVE